MRPPAASVVRTMLARASPAMNETTASVLPYSVSGRDGHATPAPECSVSRPATERCDAHSARLELTDDDDSASSPDCRSSHLYPIRVGDREEPDHDLEEEQD